MCEDIFSDQDAVYSRRYTHFQRSLNNIDAQIGTVDSYIDDLTLWDINRSGLIST